MDSNTNTVLYLVGQASGELTVMVRHMGDWIEDLEDTDCYRARAALMACRSLLAAASDLMDEEAVRLLKEEE